MMKAVLASFCLLFGTFAGAESQYTNLDLLRVSKATSAVTAAGFDLSALFDVSRAWTIDGESCFNFTLDVKPENECKDGKTFFVGQVMACFKSETDTEVRRISQLQQPCPKK